MKKLSVALLSLFALSSSPAAFAQVQARVVSSTPVIVPVSAATQVCDFAQRCHTEMITQDRTLFDVVYELGGRQYTARLASDPGPYLEVQAAVVAAPPVVAVPAAPPAPVYVAPYPYYPYPSYYSYPYYAYPAFGIGLGIGIGAFGHFHGHGHWHR